MNTAPNRRASDNASSPPGTSPTRRFSDMLKESSGSGVQAVHIDMNLAEILTVVNVQGESSGTLSAIHYDIPDGDNIFMVHFANVDGSASTGLITNVIDREYTGADPLNVPIGQYTFAGTKKLRGLRQPGGSVLWLIPTSVELIRGEGHHGEL